MRPLAIVLIALGIAAPVASSATQSEPPDPCVLITNVDASTVLTATPPKARSKLVGKTRACTYTVKKKTMTVLTLRVASKTAFAKNAKATPGLVVPILGISADAYSAANGTKLFVWKNGIQIVFEFTGLTPFVATQQSLANTAVGRL